MAAQSIHRPKPPAPSSASESSIIRDPLIKFRPFQEEAFWSADLFGLMLLMWRRQGGKTTTLGSLALRRMMEKVSRLVTYVSASIAVGGEVLLREAQIWNEALSKWRSLAERSDKLLTTSADKLSFDDFCDIFQQGKVEAKLWHSRTAYSRTKLIAPNVATARGYTGFVMLDEIQSILDFKDLFAAMEPIMSSQPDFRCLMCMTPPEDDAHYSYEISIPPEGIVFDPNNPTPRGRWYDSQANVRVHRVDAFDAAAAGVAMYDLRTRKPVTPEESRASALDRDAWDRNYALLFKSGSVAALSLLSLSRAMEAGRGQCLAAEDDFPPNWRDILSDDGPIAVGADPATTEKQKSNPFALTISQLTGGVYYARLIVRFKTADPEKAKAYLREACDLGPGRRPRKLVLDATSERFWCAEVKKEFARICPVGLRVSSEKIEYQGQEMLTKAYLGNLLVNTADDNILAMPNERWVKDDFRLVMRSKGSFENLLDSAGNHGDTFDSTKNSLDGLISHAGPVEASAAPRGTFTAGAVAERPDRLSMRPRHQDDRLPKAGVRMI